LLDIDRVFYNFNIERYFILPVYNALLAHDRIKYLLFEALYELWICRDVLNDKEHVIVDGVLILMGNFPVKSQLQKALVDHVFKGLVELNHRLIHQQLLGILQEDFLRESKRLERRIIEYHLLPAVVEDRDLALVLLIEVALHVQH
jgi:hypothetical protein